MKSNPRFTIINVDDINDIVNDCHGDERIIPYLIKVKLKEKGLPVSINILDIKNQIFEKELCSTKLVDNFYIIKWIDYERYNKNK